MSAPPEIKAAKARLRPITAAARAKAAATLGPSAAARLAEQGLRRLPLGRTACISAYLAMRDEMDPGVLLTRLAEQGHVTALPVIIAKAAPLVFRRWQPGEPTVPAGFGTREPPPSAPEVVPDLLLVPLLAFDASGFRLGYGGGFYDRTLAALRATRTVLAVGIAYDEQEVARVPRDTFDQPLDGVLTPSAFRPFQQHGT